MVGRSIRMWPSMYAQLDGINLTPVEREDARRYLQRATRLVDLLFAATARLKQLRAGAILHPVAVLRQRRGAGWPLRPAGEPRRERATTARTLSSRAG
jgi:hypothetical protein